MGAKRSYDEATLAARTTLARSAVALTAFADKADHYVMAAAGIIGHCLKSGGKVLICGNGGSAAQAQHMAAELVGRFKLRDRRALAAIALTTDTSILTAAGNDWSFADIFSRQVEGLCNATDVLVALSTSGNSPNVCKAVVTARMATARTVGMTGVGGGALADIVDCWIAAPTNDAATIQECHLAAIHCICDLVETGLE